MEGSPQAPGIKVKFHQINGNNFAMVMHKICSAPTKPQTARVIHKFRKEIQKAQKEIISQYEEQVLKKYVPLDEAGNMKKDATGNYDIGTDQEKLDLLQKDNEKFSEQEVELHITPLRLGQLEDVKLSANEIEMLGDLLADQDGPGLPFQLQGVPN